MSRDSKRGFTIIEVVLVLAIAGLIFMMVFVALPAMQRSQRNVQRKQDVQRVMSAVEEYRGRNKGRLPWSEFLKYDSWNQSIVSDIYASMSKFVMNYVDVNATSYVADPMSGATGCTENFTSPTGGCYFPYVLSPFLHTDDYNIRENLGDEAIDTFYEYNAILIVFKGKCGSSEGVVINTGSNNAFALVGVLDGGGLTCVDNS